MRKCFLLHPGTHAGQTFKRPSGRPSRKRLVNFLHEFATWNVLLTNHTSYSAVYILLMMRGLCYCLKLTTNLFGLCDRKERTQRREQWYSPADMVLL